MKRRSYLRGVATLSLPMIAMAISLSTESMTGLIPSMVLGFFWDKLIVWAAEDVS